MSTITVELTVPEALYALAALGNAALRARATKSGDDWLDEMAAGLYEQAARKIETALYPEVAHPFARADLEDEIELGLA